MSTSKVGTDQKRSKTGGRKKGTPNIVTGELKGMILAALEDEGGVEYLRMVAKEHPTSFVGLLGKVLPLQVQGDPDNPLLSGITVSFVSAEKA